MAHDNFKGPPPFAMTAQPFEHDATVQKLRTLAASSVLRDRVTELFIASIATGVRRAMTPVMAYYAARNLPDHSWERFDYLAHGRLYRNDADVPCAVCGISHSAAGRPDLGAEQIANRGWAGYCLTAPDYSHLIDLENVPNITLAYQPEHVEVLRALLKMIESLPASISTTELQKQMSVAKLMPKSNQVARRWCLSILAELGVITNASVPEYSGAFYFYDFLQRIEFIEKAFAHMSHRAEPVWPLSAGRGQPAVNWSLAYRIFPQLDIQQAIP